MKEHCKVYDLQGPITEKDIDWMYASGIDIYCEHPYEDRDSGWCDASTGNQVITPSHNFSAIIKTDEQDTWLQLYWEHRAVHRVSIQKATHKYEDAN